MPSYAQQKLTEMEAKKAIGEITKTFNDAWNKGDIERLGSLFTNDATFVTPAGIVLGKKATEKNLALRAGKSIHSATIDQVHTIGDNGFWAVGSWKIVGNNGGPTFTGYWAEYGVRQGDAWKLRMLAINVTPPKAQQAKNPRMK